MQEMLKGFGWLLAYFVPCAATALIGHYLINIPKELFRKILHCILLGSEISVLLDTVGSVIVAAYLVWCGGKTIFERIKVS